MSYNHDHSLPRPNHDSAHMEFSLLLSRSLDVLGNSQDMTRHRVDFWKFKKSLENVKDDETIYVGSQTEGVVANLGSDLDIMTVHNAVVCADNIQPFLRYSNVTLFQTDSRDTEAGYTKLKLIKLGNTNTYITDSLYKSDYNTTYMSSEFFTDNLMIVANDFNKTVPPRNFALKKAGPATPLYHHSNPEVANDMVVCFRCYCPALLQSWLRRPRRYNWPSRNILNDISQMEAHVVPVGCKGSDTYYQEWRICFTRAEIHLVHSLNDTQIKMYTILKMVSKTILKVLCPEITSYIIKNITLWMCESIPREQFTEHQLVNRILQALKFLRKCVVQNDLPNYMIPERNLFYGRIEQGQKSELINSLSSFIVEGPAALLNRLDKICGAMSFLYQEPQKADFYRIKRNTVEKLALLRYLRGTMIAPPGTTEEKNHQVLVQDDIYMSINNTLCNLVLPEFRDKSDAQAIFMARLRTFLS